MPDAAAKTIQVLVSRIRRAFGGGSSESPIKTVAGGYQLSSSGIDLDAVDFETTVSRARVASNERRWREAAALFDDALAMWRGPALMDVRTRPFAVHEADRLDEARIAALEDRAEVHIALGEPEVAADRLGELSRNRPLDERAAALLMRALYAAGRQADALATYHRIRASLDTELGVDPGPELEEAQRLVLTQDPSLRTESPAEVGVARSLPAPVSRFVGREGELTALLALLADNRLVTVTGPGGVGKTRLAIEAGGQAAPSFVDGVTFVDLSAVRDPALVPTAIADGLELEPNPNASAEDLVFDELAGRALLLVLDNMEQVAEAARFVAALMARSPGLRVLATSRVPLWIRGEREFALEPLPLPPAGVVAVGEIAANDAVVLFMDHVGRHSSTTLSESNGAAVAEICRRLDGLPLALEVVAPRARSMPMKALLDQLGHRLDLSAADVDMPDRQRTLRSAIGWSVKLLDAPTARLFRGLGVFVGGFPLEGAEAIADDGADVVGGLDELVRHSLLRSIPGDRYAMLETIREFALDELTAAGELVGVRERELSWLGTLLEAADEAFVQGHGQAEALDRADAERANVREAVAWAADTGRDEAALGLAAWRHFWKVRGAAVEGRRWLTELLARPTSYPDPLLARARMTLASFALYMGDFAEARRNWEDARPIWVRLGDRRRVAVVENNLGIVAEREDDLERAHEHGERALAILRELEDKVGVAAALGNLGVLETRRGDFAAASAWYRESLAIATELGDEETMSTCMMNLGGCEVSLGRIDTGLPWLVGALDLSRRLDDVEGTIICLEMFARAGAGLAHWDRTVTLLGGAQRMRDESGAARYPSEVGEMASLVASARESLGDEGYDRAWRSGRGLGGDELAAVALEMQSAVPAGGE